MVRLSYNNQIREFVNYIVLYLDTLKPNFINAWFIKMFAEIEIILTLPGRKSLAGYSEILASLDAVIEGAFGLLGFLFTIGSGDNQRDGQGVERQHINPFQNQSRGRGIKEGFIKSDPE